MPDELNMYAKRKKYAYPASLHLRNFATQEPYV